MFDTIIVGAGSAGCVLAARLSEDPARKVLLLEAGRPDDKREIHMPVAFSKLFRTEYDWDYWTEPQPGAAGRKMYWPRGRTLGGSSSLNAMVYIRGNRRDYDDWAAAGNDGWSWAETLPYFKKSEDNSRGASATRGAGGPLGVSDLIEINPLTRAFVEGAKQAGIPETPDFNTGDQDGCGFYQTTQRRGARCSTAAAFLKPALGRRNLTVMTGAQAARILFEGTRAAGVAYIRNGKMEQAYAEREVILAGGAVNSPQVLLLSGIGPADELKKAGVTPFHELPGVGKNLHDHLAMSVMMYSKKPVSLNELDRPTQMIPALARYLLGRRGPLTSNVAESGAFVRITPGADRPDIQFHCGAVFYLQHGLEKVAGHGVSLGPCLLYPESRGSITLRSADPLSKAVIDPNYLACENDLKLLVEGMKLAREIAAQKAYDEYRGDEYLPGKDVRTDAQMGEFVRRRCETLYHPVGSCKMGSDAMAVVDSELRVRGLQGLRVADASVMPRVVGGNTNALAIMIGERAADLIRGAKPSRAEARPEALAAV